MGLIPRRRRVVSHQTVRLRRGRHRSPERGVCTMELASMLAGRSFSDHCSKVCPVLAGFVRGYNDGIGNRKRQEMRPLASHLVGTRRDLAVGRIRERMLRDWADDLAGRRAARLRKLHPPLPDDSPEEVGSFCAAVARTSVELHRETLAMLERVIECTQEPDPVADTPDRLLTPV